MSASIIASIFVGAAIGSVAGHYLAKWIINKLGWNDDLY